ncbi:conjugal transfer protein TraG [Vibrio sp. S11_S32]|uniref:conjugal transfer protein TraG N-terminal domain-containing protein n=1 Tax=Vibrio sp. S11_S32 TaxID=2720225 RepID=UPI0016811120|nr:conjugal transfer protein TraG N-terminal domain-containing protein [Vibrio sp. S11_S32]MBD1577707.1 conjugal transfer protein TraG [Vibrio sp. S11_S32]
MLTNEPTDLFFIPLANFMSGQIWDLILQTKLYIIPFIITLVVLANEARAAGADEGTPAIQAFRKFEAKAWAMLVIILFAVQPFSFSSPETYRDIKYKSYSCLAGGLGTYLTVDQLSRNPTVQSIEGANPSLWNALMNMFSTGVTNAAIHAIPCDVQEGENSLRVALMNAQEDLPDGDAYQTTLEYNMQCYNPAIKRLSDLSQMSNNSQSQINMSDLSFNSDAIRTALNGMNIDGYTNKLTATVKLPEFSEKNWYGYTATKVDCTTLGDSLHTKLVNYTKVSDRASDYSAINRRSNATQAENDDSNANSLYNNVMRHEGVKFTTKLMGGLDGAVDGSASGFGMTTLSPAGGALEIASASGDVLDVAGNMIRNTVTTASNLIGVAVDSTKVLQYQITAPLVISIAKMLLIIAFPLMMLLTGFNGNLLLVSTIGYFAIEFSKFTFELGAYLDESLTSFLFNITYLDLPEGMPVSMMKTISTSINLIGQMANYGLVAIWLVFVGWMGVKLFGSMGMSDSAGQQAASTARSGVSLVSSAGTSMATKAGTKIASNLMK